MFEVQKFIIFARYTTVHLKSLVSETATPFPLKNLQLLSFFVKSSSHAIKCLTEVFRFNQFRGSYFQKNTGNEKIISLLCRKSLDRDCRQSAKYRCLIGQPHLSQDWGTFAAKSFAPISYRLYHIAYMSEMVNSQTS